MIAVGQCFIAESRCRQAKRRRFSILFSCFLQVPNLSQHPAESLAKAVEASAPRLFTLSCGVRSLRQVDDFDSLGCVKLAEEMGAGDARLPSLLVMFQAKGISVKKTAEIAKAFQLDGVQGATINHFARSSRERDMFRWTLCRVFCGCVFGFCYDLHCLRINLPIRPYVASIPVMTQVGLDRVLQVEEVAFVLPSTVFAELFKRGPKVFKTSLYDLCSPSDYWSREDPEFLAKIIGDGSSDMSQVIPIHFHEDGVPRWHNESATFYSWTTPMATGGSWVSRHCICGLGSSCITRETRAAVLEIIAWDMDSLRSGRWPVSDHTGAPFRPGSRDTWLVGARVGCRLRKLPALVSRLRWTTPQALCGLLCLQAGKATKKQARLPMFLGRVWHLCFFSASFRAFVLQNQGVTANLQAQLCLRLVLGQQDFGWFELRRCERQCSVENHDLQQD